MILKHKLFTMKQLFTLTILTLFIFYFSSCKKEKETLAIINVRDINNLAVSDAKVVLFGNPQPSLGAIVRMDTLISDLNGNVVFNYTELFKLGQAGFADLDIRVMKNTLEGSGRILIKEEETNYKTIIIQ